MRSDDGRTLRLSGFIHHGGFGVLVSLACVAAAFAGSAAPGWPDTPAGRQAAAAALQALNADLLGHPSATLTLDAGAAHIVWHRRRGSSPGVCAARKNRCRPRSANCWRSVRTSR